MDTVGNIEFYYTDYRKHGSFMDTVRNIQYYIILTVGNLQFETCTVGKMQYYYTDCRKHAVYFRTF